MAPRDLRALRVAIVRKGRIVEERVFRCGEPVTLGSGPRNAFALPDAPLPERFALLRATRGGWSLAFDASMPGRLRAASGAADLGALAAEGVARRRGAVHLLPLHGDAWGKVRLGDVTVVFQLVAPPPLPPAAALPQAARGNRFRSMDRTFVAVLALSLAAHVGAYVGLRRAPAREEVTLEEIPDRFAKLLLPERRPEAAPRREEAPREVAAEPKAEEKHPDPDEKPAAPQGAPDEGGDGEARKAARAAAVARAVQAKGLLRVLGALGPGATRGRATTAVFSGGDGAFGDVAAAISGAGRAAVAGDSPGLAARRGETSGAPASIGDLATGGGAGARVALGAKAEVRVAGTVAAEDAEIDSPDVDQAKLGAFVRARMGAIKACYEAQLKRNPALRGKIRIRFTILETGAVTDVVAVEDGVGSPEVAACIVATMRSWRTPFRPAGTVAIEYPFLFSAS